MCEQLAAAASRSSRRGSPSRPSCRFVLLRHGPGCRARHRSRSSLRRLAMIVPTILSGEGSEMRADRPITRGSTSSTCSPRWCLTPARRPNPTTTISRKRPCSPWATCSSCAAAGRLVEDTLRNAEVFSIRRPRRPGKRPPAHPARDRPTRSHSLPPVAGSAVRAPPDRSARGRHHDAGEPLHRSVRRPWRVQLHPRISRSCSRRRCSSG